MATNDFFSEVRIQIQIEIKCKDPLTNHYDALIGVCVKAEFTIAVIIELFILPSSLLIRRKKLVVLVTHIDQPTVVGFFDQYGKLSIIASSVYHLQ